MNQDLGIGSWIARRARMSPHRTALIFGERRWTYRDLSVRITRLARGLAYLGAQHGDCVAFFGPNRPEALETLFACGQLGARFVPVHPGLDVDAAHRVLERAEPSLVVVTADCLAALRRALPNLDPRATVVIGLVDTETRAYETLIVHSPAEPFQRSVPLDEDCMLAFSSGTTGGSKGVRLTHKNLLFNAINMLASLDLLHDDVMLVSAPLYRMGGLGFALTTLLKGATCVIQEYADPARSLSLIERYRVTALFDAVGALEGICREASARDRGGLSTIRICLSGGSMIPASLRAELASLGVTLQPGYGLTEAAPVALLSETDDTARSTESAGRPVFFCESRIVDEALRDVSPGEAGELLLRGPNITPGYWNAESDIATRFVDGWLRTGDAARVTADGSVEVLGRVADALVVGERRVHAGPLEMRLRLRGLVAECAFVDIEGQLVLFVAGARPGTSDRAIKARCLEELGITPTIRHLPELPKNANGKVLRGELRRMGPPHPVRGVG